ncbi:transposase [Pseudomonas marginalis]|uniref:transposase n=1 Tax=Pseudomonas marginalis TaxID=298 RepID=UPI000A82A017|nr:transposase [Pseudomonas marginalis]RMO63224.1 hypothetical protein ALQ38_02262 [Pseudomonas marginalis pv. marginalis]
MAEFSEQHKQMGAQLLTMAATLKRGYQALHAGENLQVLQPHIKDLERLHGQWLSDLDNFKTSLREQGAEPQVLDYANEAFGRWVERIKQLAS